MAEIQIVFQCVGGLPVPVLPIGSDGQVRQADGVRWLGTEHVTQRWGVDEAAVHEAYAAFLLEAGTGAKRQQQQTIAHQLLRDRFGHLPDHLFQQYLEVCRQRGFNPWGRHMWADTRWNDGKEELHVELTADGFFAVAIRTRELERFIGPQWCGRDGQWRDVWTEKGFPFAARAGVLRKGMAEPLYMVARWESYAPKNDDGFWQSKPDFMIGKCACCLALRRAFSELLDGIYCPEEMEQTRHLANRPDDPAPDSPPEDVPQSPRQLHLALLDLGIREERRRDEIVETFRQRLPILYARNVTAFYREVLRAVKADPQEYGIAEVAEAS